MSVNSIMATPDMPLSKLLGKLSGQVFPLIIPVVDAQQRLVGILSLRDLLTAIYQQQATKAARA